MDQTNATLLLVDDDAMNRDALSRRLARRGYTVLTAESGPTRPRDGRRAPRRRRAARRHDARHERPRDAAPAARIALGLGAAGHHGDRKDRTDDVVEALDLGANDYVTKPIDFPIALARIRTQVTARRADPLTGLPNRAMFMDRVERLIASRGAAPTPSFAVLFLDIDRFKVVNDSLGHLAGDELLVGVARRLEQSLRSTDAVARLRRRAHAGPARRRRVHVLLDGVRTAADAAAVAERLLAAAARAVRRSSGREVVVSISIGIVMSDARYQRAEDMVRDADTAMYRAKAQGKARCEVFDTSMLAAAEERLQLESDLRHALERSELQLYYQPIVELATARLSGFEALLRWHHPERGLVSPARVHPDRRGDRPDRADRPVGARARPARRCERGRRSSPTAADLTINVNLSARQCVQPDLVRERRATSSPRPACAPERLKLEITEGVVLENSEAVVDVLNALRALGVQLGLDDFGMGYSALSYLRQFPFQTLKIDRSFVDGMQADGNAEIIRAIVSLAGGLSMDVTAEGIETAEQVRDLQRPGLRVRPGLLLLQAVDDGRRPGRAPGTRLLVESLIARGAAIPAEAGILARDVAGLPQSRARAPARGG